MKAIKYMKTIKYMKAIEIMKIKKRLCLIYKKENS